MLVLPAIAAAVFSTASLAASPPPADPPAPVVAPAEPFAFADFTWMTGNPRTHESPLDSKAFTGEFRADVNYVYDFNHPRDNTIGGSSEIFRSNEVQVTQLGIGGLLTTCSG